MIAEEPFDGLMAARELEVREPVIRMSMDASPSMPSIPRVRDSISWEGILPTRRYWMGNDS